MPLCCWPQYRWDGRRGEARLELQSSGPSGPDTSPPQTGDTSPQRDTAKAARADTGAARTMATGAAADSASLEQMIPVYLAMVVFGVAMVIIGIGFLRSMEGDGQVAVESHWGGFGGGGGGWRFSRPLSYLIALVFFAGMLAALALGTSGKSFNKTPAQMTPQRATQPSSSSQPAQTSAPTPPASPGASRP